jgi:hypothetical protein
MACLAFSQTVFATVYDESQIRTWTYPVNGWNMQHTRYFSVEVNTAVPFTADQVVTAKVMVYSDPTEQQEVFNLVRGTPEIGHGKSGGAFNYLVMDGTTGTRFIANLDRGPCPRTSGYYYDGGYYDQKMPCDEPTSPNRVDNFFASSLNGTARHFFATNIQRATIKVDYICSSCPTQTINSYYMKLGPKNMTPSPGHTGLLYDLSPSGFYPPSMVDQAATIFTDPQNPVTFGTPYGAPIQADNFENVAANLSNQWRPDPWSPSFVPINAHPTFRGRAGVLWWGWGCSGSMAPSNPNTFNNRGECGTIPSVYGMRLAFAGNGLLHENTYTYDDTPAGSNIPLTYSSTSANRGWIKLEYSGTKLTSLKVPYLMKTKALSIGSWSMAGTDANGVPTQPSKEIPLSDLGVSADRLSKLECTIISDKQTFCQGCQPGAYATNFIAAASGSGLGVQGSTPMADAEIMAGGTFYVDGRRNKIVMLWHRFPAQTYAIYMNPYYKGTGNRGWIRADYLVGGCDAGGTGFSLKGIGLSSQIVTCSGSGSTVIEGSGSKVVGTTDEFTYEYKQETGSTRSLITRLDGMSPASNFTNPAQVRTGIMVRAGLNNNDRYASILVTPQNTVTFRYRNATGGNNGTDYNVSVAQGSQVWLKLDFTSGTTFKPWYSTQTPAVWKPFLIPGTQTQVSVSISGFPTTYYGGLVALNAGEPRTNTGTYSNLSGF